MPGNWWPVPRPLKNMADKPCYECPEKLLSQRVEKANELLNRCDNLRKTIEGLPKLRRKLFAELRFLTTVSLLCTNVKHELTLKCMYEKNG